MKMVTVPYVVRILYPSLIWNREENSLFLTFDDGPNPDITPKILDILAGYKVKATFFCVGDNVRKYPEIYNNVLEQGHRTGNHTFNHLNGWKTSDDDYFTNIKKAGEFINSNLFRPPYGKIRRSQIKTLKKDFEIIMWTVLTYDFSKKISPEDCYRNSKKGLRNGSIIVFHDSVKSKKNVLYALPKFIETALNKGFEFDVL